MRGNRGVGRGGGIEIGWIKRSLDVCFGALVMIYGFRIYGFRKRGKLLQEKRNG